jgi:hypothetical protein
VGEMMITMPMATVTSRWPMVETTVMTPMATLAQNPLKMLATTA